MDTTFLLPNSGTPSAVPPFAPQPTLLDPSRPLVLSGRTMVARITFVNVDGANWVGSREGAVPDDGRQPLAGDVRIAATLDPDSRISATRTFPCVGTLAASIFDGACWQRFDLTSLTNNIRFKSAVQLQGTLRWVCTCVLNAHGRLCSSAPSPSGFIVYAAAMKSAPAAPPSASAAAVVASPTFQIVEPMPETSELRRLVYCSRRSPDLRDGDLAAGLILPAAERNRRDGITGCLYVGQMSFVQAIEGPANVVRALMKRIIADPRHSGVRITSDTRARVRLFAQWSLKVTHENGTFESRALEELARDAAARSEPPGGQTNEGTSGKRGNGASDQRVADGSGDHPFGGR